MGSTREQEKCDEKNKTHILTGAIESAYKDSFAGLPMLSKNNSQRSSNKSLRSMNGIQSHPQIQDYFLRGQKTIHEETTLALNLNELLRRGEESDEANIFYESQDFQEIEWEE